VEEERGEAAGGRLDLGERRRLRAGERGGLGARREHARPRDLRLAVEPDGAAAGEGHERGAAMRKRAPQLLERDPAAGEEVLEHRALRGGPPERRQRVDRPGLRGGVLDAAARRPLRPPASVQAGRERGAEQLAGRHEVVLLRPADEPDERRGEGGKRIEDLDDLAQRVPVGRRGREPHHVAGGAPAAAEGNGHALPEGNLRGERRRHAIGEGAAHGGGDGDLDEHGRQSI